MMCRYCNRRRACRPRGLCWKCYYSPAKHLYPVTSKYAPKGEPTQEQVDEMVREGMRNLPSWWWKEKRP